MSNFGLCQSPATTAVASHLIHSISYSFRPSHALGVLLEAGSAAPRDSSTNERGRSSGAADVADDRATATVVHWIGGPRSTARAPYQSRGQAEDI